MTRALSLGYRMMLRAATAGWSPDPNSRHDKAWRNIKNVVAMHKGPTGVQPIADDVGQVLGHWFKRHSFEYHKVSAGEGLYAPKQAPVGLQELLDEMFDTTVSELSADKYVGTRHVEAATRAIAAIENRLPPMLWADDLLQIAGHHVKHSTELPIVTTALRALPGIAAGRAAHALPNGLRVGGLLSFRGPNG